MLLITGVGKLVSILREREPALHMSTSQLSLFRPPFSFLKASHFTLYDNHLDCASWLA